MAPLSPDEIQYSRKRAEEIKRLKAEAKSRSSRPAAGSAAAPVQTSNKPKVTPTEAAKTAKPKQRDSGLISQVGGALQYVAGGDWLPDTLNAAAAGINAITPDDSPLKGFTQGMDDKILSAPELEAYKEQKTKEVSQGNNLVDKAAIGLLNNTDAVASGVQAGVALPVTLAAKAANQDAPWSRPPDVVKDSPISDAIFTIGKVVTPTLLTGGALAAAGAPVALTTGVGALGVESTVETLANDTADDLIAGRTIAVKLGEIADNFGYDGAALTKGMLEGEGFDANTLNFAVGLVQNFGINFGADKLFKFFGPKVASAFNGEAVDDAAKALGKTPDEVQKAVDDVNVPPQNGDYEPHDLTNIDNTVPVSKPTPGNQYISDEALVAESFRKSGLYSDGLTKADRKYFTNWDAVTTDQGLQKVLQEATKALKKVVDNKYDLSTIVQRASAWWNVNAKRIASDDLVDIDRAYRSFLKFNTTPIFNESAIRSRTATELDLMSIEGLAKIGKNKVTVNEPGFIVAALVGEELGVRLKKLALQAVRLENAVDPVDFTKVVDQFVELQDKANLFMIPLRRGKRRWGISGQVQQTKNIRKLRDADIVTSRTTKDVSYHLPSRQFEANNTVDNDLGFTVRELWQKYKEGDLDAGNTLKAYLEAIAYAEPETAVSQVANLSKVLQDQFNKGNSDAVTNIYYGFMLSRVATQVASASSSISRLVAEPLGAVMTGERAYGTGQLIGGLTHMFDGLQAAARAFKENRSFVGGSKIDSDIYSLKLRQQNLDQIYEGYRKQLIENGADNTKLFGAAAWHTLQTIGNHPITSVGNRFLMAGDEAAKVIFGAQVATGRAWKEAAEKGILKNTKEFEDLIEKNFKRVFDHGVTTGKIIDGDVLDAAKALTFQSDIPTNGNIIDNAFLAMEDATKKSGWWRFFNPFPRVSYNILEVAGRYEPTGVLRSMVPRYKSIMNGEMGDVAQIQLKSQIAFGRAFMMSTAGLALLGYTTGYNSGNLPKTSFIIPTPGGGYKAIPYNKLEPFATLLAVTSDAVNGLRDRVISQGQYDRFMEEMLFAIAMATFDKSFQSGLMDMTAIFDVRNFGEGTIQGLANATGVVSPGIVRMMADFVQPYKTVNAEQAVWQDFWAKLRAKTIGGIGNPQVYDELTGKPIPKSAVLGDPEDYWANVLGSVINEFGYPGRITNAPKGDKVRSELDKIGYKADINASIRTFENIPLSIDQQSKLSKDIATLGNLRGYLTEYLGSQIYKDKLNQYNSLRRQDSAVGNAGNGTRANEILKDIYTDIDSIRRNAKRTAVYSDKGQLMKDPDFVRKFNQIRMLKGDLPFTQGGGLQELLGMPK